MKTDGYLYTSDKTIYIYLNLLKLSKYSQCVTIFDGRIYAKDFE